MRFALLNAVVAGLLSAVMSADVRDCFTQVTNGRYQGCYEDSGDRILADVMLVSDSNSVPLCIEHCGSKGYPYAGLEYSKECFCGKEVKRWTKKNEADCKMKCSGSHEMCGGGWRISLYTTKGISTQLPEKRYKGCYEDSRDRILADDMLVSDSNSVPLCIEHCGNQGYPYAGLEASKECFCGKEVKRWIQKNEADCKRKCSGSSEMCGGGWRISLYTTKGISTQLPESGTLSFPDGCNKCSCTWKDQAFQLSCDPVACPQLKCSQNLQQTLRGECCPTCKRGCFVEDVGIVDVGEKIPTDDPCETCACEENQEGSFSTFCAKRLCTMNCPYGFIDDGSCCGKCKECDPNECPSIPCQKKYQFKTDDMCCPQCECRYKGETVKPGPVGDSCDGCACNNGAIECDPVQCASLTCVDPVKGDNCCYTCPNGNTCRHEKKTKVVIREGETKVVGSTYCFCSSSFWYPYAFCAKLKVKDNAFLGTKNYKNIVAKWFNPKN